MQISKKFITNGERRLKSYIPSSKNHIKAQLHEIVSPSSGGSENTMLHFYESTLLSIPLKSNSRSLKKIRKYETKQLENKIT